MGRRAKFKKRENDGSEKKKEARLHSDDEDMMNDEIDAFHKQRDKVPLNMNEDSEESDGDNEQPVLDLEDEDEDEDDIKYAPGGLEAKILRTQKFMRDKFGDINDDELDESEEKDDDGISYSKKDLHGGDNNNDTQASDDEDPILEEKEVVNLQSKRAGGLSLEDYGIENESEDETERELTFQEMLDDGKQATNVSLDKVDKEDTGITYEIVKKDLRRLTKEEQIDIVYSSHPELMGVLTDLSDALDQLENKVNPLLNKIRGRYTAEKGGMHYLEVKQLLLQSYCQAAIFFLLLTSEGHPTRDHPVSARVAEIGRLITKMKEMDENLPFDMEEILKNETSDVSVVNIVEKTASEASDKDPSQVSRASPEHHPAVEPNEAAQVKINSTKGEQHGKPQDKQVGVQSMEMLKVRAALEEKLKQKGVFNSIAPKNARVRENAPPVNRQLETLDDFDDEAMEVDGVANHTSVTLHQHKMRQPKKVVSGDADIPARSDLGERRRKYEERQHDLEVKRRKYEELEGAEINSSDDNHNLSDGNADTNEELDGDSDLEYLKQVQCQRAAKLAEKSNKYSRTPELPSFEDTAVDGKRHITTQIEKNRGLTRQRNKLIKNPRKKYRLKHDKKKKARSGQVQNIRKPTGSYGGEATGINARVTRSVRL